MTIRHEFPCKQHPDYRAARYQRKHINLLLLDSCEEYSRTYGSDGRPQEHASVETALKRSAGRQLQSKAVVGTASLVKRTKDLWQSASVEGGQEAADLTKQVGSQRTPTGTFFGLANPGLARPSPSTDSVPNMRQDNITQSALGLRKGPAEDVDLDRIAYAAQPKPEQQGTGGPGSSKRPWLMPHQLRDRNEGGKAAQSVNSKRSPSGGFANFDLAKAPR
eukprot:jgi/Ulvmu1/2908/UM147_0006.1